MATEIERKFLVVGDEWKNGAAGRLLRQGYLSTNPDRIVRVRLDGADAWLTVKGVTSALTRLEFEFAIPVPDATEMLEQLCERPLLEKTRYRIFIGDRTWEVDEFHGDNEGLVVAEVELERAGQPFERPAWLGREVSDDPRYFNSNLIAHPYREWRGNGPGARS